LTEEKKHSEEELVVLLRNKDQQAFSYLYDNYSEILNGIIHRIVEDKELAEDILQEAFVKIWNNFALYDSSKGRLFTWMLNIARNHTIDTIRSKGYKKQNLISADENAVSNSSDEHYSIEKLDVIGIKQKIGLLKPELRNIIELTYFGGYTQDEVAKAMGIPLGTIKTRVRTAISTLRKLLG
jgi:RNA polymerase sigma factor (sigma-70 family)